MAFDTVTIESPFITDFVAEKIEELARIKTSFDCQTSELLYKFVSRQLKGSYDSNISVMIMREMWVKNRSLDRLEKVFCKPYIRLEFSVHKFQQGHNVCNGPLNLMFPSVQCIAYICACIGLNINELPSIDEWHVIRVDYACVFPIGKEAVFSFFRSLDSNKMNYPRRKISIYRENGNVNSIHIAGRRHTLRLYHKGTEFRMHDKKRLTKLKLPDLDIIEEIADDILRVEVQINKMQLKDDFNGQLPKINDISLEYAESVFTKTMQNFIKETKFDSQKNYLRNEQSVQHYLFSNFNRTKAKNLYAFWVQLVSSGEILTKHMHSKGSYYTKIKELVNAGISWRIDTNAIEGDYHCLYPDDFMPTADSSYRFKNIDIKKYRDNYKFTESVKYI